MHSILVVTLAVGPLFASAVNINALFDIDPSCNAYPVQQWADESLALIQAANNAYYNAKGDANDANARVARGYFQGLMNYNPQAGNVYNVEAIEAVFSRTVAFLSAGTIPEGNTRPYLTCGDKIFKKVNLDSIAKQRDGTTNVVSTEGNPITVRQEYASVLSELVKPVALGTSYQYVLDSGPAGICDLTTLGQTFLDNENLDVSKDAQPIIVLCPENYARWVLTNTLGDTSPNPSRNLMPLPIPKQKLYSVLPKSQTLLHEILHMLHRLLKILRTTHTAFPNARV